MSRFGLYTLEETLEDGGHPEDRYWCHQPEETWPRVLADMAQDFEAFPQIVELWLCERPSIEDYEKVLLWSRP